MALKCNKFRAVARPTRQDQMQLYTLLVQGVLTVCFIAFVSPQRWRQRQTKRRRLPVGSIEIEIHFRRCV
eukprot:51802-Rhodomonas_salina.1